MLTDLNEQHQFPSTRPSRQSERGGRSLYMTQSEIEEGFDKDNNQIKPLVMTVKTTRLKALIEAVQAQGVYRVEIEHVDEHEVIHLLLHRISSPKVSDKRVVDNDLFISPPLCHLSFYMRPS
ncbi:DUF2913 family protein [Vibrio lentus]|uniref:DUF2913 family protein n=1 Tax=Vibrio lentus TaxID=136468 RepID=UPI0039A74D48